MPSAAPTFTSSPPTLPAPAPFYRASALATRWGVTRQTIWRMRARGDLPEPLRLSPQLVGWTGQQVADVEARRTAEAAAREANRVTST